ncbi:MAG: hypothetical protein UW30_C0010G0004 [Candidatus Giovannonibacteria bacterium GW2011_GWA2_44_13b]|uniref:HicB family protein n=1 Tax=Candidatus Giovannonibacteria bacterium GW2011_GWA2_44_13b TaxID=1618647 RepID=A0A0G1H433_9BACT|nr:MAG: hypothetical protein UW30_C0010G0004 [Candidatus Giovannonibacteria bacterium GW2011_GWA2_44_13b]
MTKLNAQLPVSVFKEGKHFIAYTPALDLSTSGKTHEQAMARFNEAADIFFEELAKKRHDRRSSVRMGWEKVKKHLAPPSLIAQESRQVEFNAGFYNTQQFANAGH